MSEIAERPIAPLRIGTRASPLALWQARHFLSRIGGFCPMLQGDTAFVRMELLNFDGGVASAGPAGLTLTLARRALSQCCFEVFNIFRQIRAVVERRVHETKNVVVDAHCALKLGNRLWICCECRVEEHRLFALANWVCKLALTPSVEMLHFATELLFDDRFVLTEEGLLIVLGNVRVHQNNDFIGTHVRTLFKLHVQSFRVVPTLGRKPPPDKDGSKV